MQHKPAIILKVNTTNYNTSGFTHFTLQYTTILALAKEETLWQIQTMGNKKYSTECA